MTDLPAAPDYQMIFEAAPACYIVLAPDLTIVAVSDAFLRVTMTTRASLVGRALFEAFPDDPGDPAATGVRNLRRSLERVLRDRVPVTIPIQKYAIERPAKDGGGFEERYWSPSSTPLLGPDGEVHHILHQIEDVTSMVRLQQRGTEQERAIEALAIEGEARLRQVLDSTPDAMIVVDPDARIRFANAQTQLLFGYTRDELLAMRVDDLVPLRFRAEHGVIMRGYFGRPAPRPMGAGKELYGLRKDGVEVPVEVSLSPLLLEGRMCVSASIRDVTERKRLEALAKVTAERLTSAVESFEDGFALFDENDRVLLCNSAYRRLLPSMMSGTIIGRSYEDVLDAWIAELDLRSEGEREAFRSARCASRRAAKAEVNLRTRDGRSLRAIHRATPEGGIVETIWDLTEDAHRETKLYDAQRQAEAASAAKSEFLASMSHELRTPLNSILGFSQLLIQDKREPLSRRHINRAEHIQRSGEHLLRLIDDILDLARIESGRVAVSIELVEVASVIDEVHTTLAPLAARAGLVLSRDELPALPPITADRTRFSQILMNFGSNAVKYNRPGGEISFRVSRPDDTHVRIAVHDTGPGIPADKQALLFQPFQRAGQETGPIEGTGIGLVITQRLAALMNGRVGFQSEAGAGSSFWIDLPVDRTGAATALPARAKHDGRASLDAAVRAAILYIEDNPANVSFMRDFFADYSGIELHVAGTAEEGVELALARAPDVIIADINLPGMSGVDALRILRNAPQTAHVPVIALTAAVTERDRRLGQQAGFDRYLTKPVQVDELESALAELCSSKRKDV